MAAQQDLHEYQDRNPPHALRRIAGNALFYVLMGVVLFAALSYTVMQQNDGSGAAQQISEQKAEIYASHLISHANAVKNAIELMLQNGSTIDDIDFVRPDEAGYDTAPHIHKVFHPGGGGITPMVVKDEYFAPASAERGWDFQTATNVEWTASTQTDVIYSFIDIEESICQQVNEKLIGDNTIETLTSDTLTQLFRETSGGNDNFEDADCPNCVGKTSFCVEHSSIAGDYAFYTIVAAR